MYDMIKPRKDRNTDNAVCEDQLTTISTADLTDGHLSLSTRLTQPQYNVPTDSFTRYHQ